MGIVVKTGCDLLVTNAIVAIVSFVNIGVHVTVCLE